MLKSKGINPVTYVGYTNDLKKRIKLHNSGKGAKFTRGRKWKLIYKEKLNSKKVTAVVALLFLLTNTSYAQEHEQHEIKVSTKQIDSLLQAFMI